MLVGRLHGHGAAPRSSAPSREVLARVGLTDAADRRIATLLGRHAPAPRASPRRSSTDRRSAHPRRAGQLARPGGPARPPRPHRRRCAARPRSLFSTHVLADVERICDRVAILDHGRLVTEGPLDELLDRYALPVYRLDPEHGQAERGRAPGGEPARRRVDDRRRRRARPRQGRPSPIRPAPPASSCRPSSRPASALVSVERVRPTLEDVFLQLVGRERARRAHDGPADRLPPQGAPRVVADDAAADRRRPVRLRRHPLAPHGRATCPRSSSSPSATSSTVADPDPTAADAVDQLQKNLGQFGALAAIVLAMGAVGRGAGARDRGVHPHQAGVSRRPSWPPSSSSSAAVLAVATIVAVVLAWAYTAVLFEPPSVAGWIAMGASWPGSPCWPGPRSRSSASTVTRSAAAAAGIGFIALIGLSIWPPSRRSAAGCRPGSTDRPSRSPRALRSTASCWRPRSPHGRDHRRLVLAAWLAFRRQEL